MDQLNYLSYLRADLIEALSEVTETVVSEETSVFTVICTELVDDVATFVLDCRTKICLVGGVSWINAPPSMPPR